MSKRAVSRLLQIANNLTGDARRIVEANNMTGGVPHLADLRLGHFRKSVRTALVHFHLVEEIFNYPAKLTNKAVQRFPLFLFLLGISSIL